MVEEQYSFIKGQEFKKHLDEAYNQIKQGQLKLANIQIKLFIEAVPDDSSAAFALREKLKKLDNYYNSVMKHLYGVKYDGRFFEENDAIEERKRQTYYYLIEKYYICNNIYEKYKLYENNSIVEYNL